MYLETMYMHQNNYVVYVIERCVNKCGKYIFGDPKLNNYCEECFAKMITMTNVHSQLLSRIDGNKVMVVLCKENFIYLFDENDFDKAKYCNPLSIIDLNIYSSIKSTESHPFGFAVTSKDEHSFTFIAESEFAKSNWIGLIGRAIVKTRIMQSTVDEIDEPENEDYDNLFDEPLNEKKEVVQENNKKIGIFDDSDDEPLIGISVKEKKPIKGIFDDDEEFQINELFDTKTKTKKKKGFKKGTKDPFEDDSDDSDWMDSIRKKSNF